MMRLRTWIGLTCTATFTLMGLVVAAPKKMVPPPRLAARTTVLPLSEGPQMLVVVGTTLPGAGTPSYWTPRAADLRRLEADLPRSLTFYYRQYIGVTEGGKRLILINGFSADVAPDFTGGKSDWHRHTVQVMDGGRGFFQATYDLHTRQFVGPHFNGLG